MEIYILSNIFVIAGLCSVLIVRDVLAHKERILMAKLNKARDVNEVLAVDPIKQEEVKIEENPLVDIADMPDLPMQDKQDRH